MREHQKQKHHEAEQGGDEESGAFEQQKLAMAQRNRRTERAREDLHKHIDKVGMSISMGANLFQMMVRGDSEKELQKKLSPDIAGKIKDKLVDKIMGKIKDGLTMASDIGEEVVKKSEMVFGVIKSTIENKIKTGQQLTVLQLADHVTAAFTEKQLELVESLHAAVDALPKEKLAGVGDMVANFDRMRTNPDDPDSPERGNLREGMKADAFENILGLPAGDMVGAEQVALDAYAEFKSEVGSIAMTVAEQTDQIQHRMAHPHEDKEKLAAAEEKMGPKFKATVERDKTLRGRVAATGQ